MFLFFGRKTSVKPVRGGRQVVTECPSCGVTAKFHECTQEKTLHAYVVIDLFTDKQVVFRCTNCGDVFELDEEAARAQASASGGDRAARERKAADDEHKRREARRRAEAESAAKTAAKIEQELAELKRKLRSP